MAASYRVTIEPVPEMLRRFLDDPNEAAVFSRRILSGEFDHDLETILEAAHHRKREIRDERRRQRR